MGFSPGPSVGIERGLTRLLNTHHFSTLFSEAVSNLTITPI
jgi:hypothetical protein